MLAVRVSVVLGEWLDRSIASDLDVAVLADRLGFEQLWIGEMAKLDAPALGAIVVERTSRIEPVLGPLAVTVRTPAQIAMATATVASLGRRTHVALGTSSNVVARWHGVSRAGAASKLDGHLTSLQALFAGEKVNGYRLRERIPAPTTTVAAFGPRAIATAAGADRMVLNMVSVATAAKLAPQHPNTAVWLAAAIDPTPDELAWQAQGFVGYLAAPGYAEMFIDAGFGDLVEFARTRPHPREVAARIPIELLDTVALVGDEAHVRARIAEYEAAGIDEVCIVPPPLEVGCGRRTLEALAPA